MLETLNFLPRLAILVISLAFSFQSQFPFNTVWLLVFVLQVYVIFKKRSKTYASLVAYLGSVLSYPVFLAYGFSIVIAIYMFIKCDYYCQTNEPVSGWAVIFFYLISQFFLIPIFALLIALLLRVVVKIKLKNK